MQAYKIVASDLDGTLLVSSSHISRENLDAIHGLAEKGVFFVPATGRTIAELPEELLHNPDIRFIIHANGSAILDTKTGERTLMCMPNTLVCEVLSIVNSYDTYITMRHDGACIIDAKKHNAADLDRCNVWPLHSELVGAIAQRKEDFAAYSEAADEVEVFSVFFASDDDREACRQRLLATGALMVAEACEHNLEIFSIHAGKGNALHRLCDMLGIDRAATISVGDSDNDATITKAAGLGLAVANSCGSLKAIANEVICSNDEHAIAYILAHYFE